jgi:hypothetical protein
MVRRGSWRRRASVRLPRCNENFISNLLAAATVIDTKLLVGIVDKCHHLVALRLPIEFDCATLQIQSESASRKRLWK